MLLHDGELPAQRAEQVRAHATACDRCSAWMENLASVGAVVRGEVIPTFVLEPDTRRAPAWRPAPVVARLVPAIAAVVAVAVGLVVAQPPRDTEVSLGGRSSVETVPLPTSTPSPDGTQASPPTDGPTGTPSGGGAGGSGDSAGTSPDNPGSGVAGTTEPETITLGVLVPGGQTGAGEPVVRAVAVALAAANDAGGVDGARMELLVGDADDPTSAAQLVERGVRVIVGGYGAPGATAQAFAGRGVAWFGPTDLAPSPLTNVVPVEIGHGAAGKLLGDALVGRGYERAVALTDASDERHLVDGVKSRMPVDAGAVDDPRACAAYLDTAALTGAEVIVLALNPEGVAACVGALRTAHPFHQVVVPATALDEALAGVPKGFALAAALGAPAPEDPGPGPTRFRSATGITRNYRALVSYAATEVALAALRQDARNPLGGFAAGGTYRSDLLTLNPASSPPNVAVQVVFLGDIQVGVTNPAPTQSQGLGG